MRPSFCRLAVFQSALPAPMLGSAEVTWDTGAAAVQFKVDMAAEAGR